MSLEKLKKSADLFKELLENDRTRVFEIAIGSGKKLPSHHHPDHIIYALTDQKLRFTTDDQSKDIEIKAGDAKFFEEVIHAVENIGETDAHSIIIELR